MQVELTSASINGSEPLDMEDASLLGTQQAANTGSERSCVATHLPPAAIGLCLGILLFCAAITLWTPRGGSTTSEILLSRIRDIERGLDRLEGSRGTGSNFAAPTQSASAAAQCTSESCPDSALVWSSPVTGRCYATQLEDFYVNCKGKKAATDSIISGTSAPVSS